MERGKIARLRLESYPFRVQEWLRKNAVSIAHRTIGEEFLRLCDDRGMTERYKQSLQIESELSEDGIKLRIYVDYKDRDGKNIPLDEYFEYGTRDHWIEPKDKKALHWIKQGGGSPQSIYSQSSETEDGESMFSKGHYVKGIEARMVMTDTQKNGYPKFKAELMTQLNAFMDETATGIGI